MTMDIAMGASAFPRDRRKLINAPWPWRWRGVASGGTPDRLSRGGGDELVLLVSGERVCERASELSPTGSVRPGTQPRVQDETSEAVRLYPEAGRLDLHRQSGEENGRSRSTSLLPGRQTSPLNPSPKKATHPINRRARAAAMQHLDGLRGIGRLDGSLCLGPLGHMPLSTTTSPPSSSLCTPVALHRNALRNAPQLAQLLRRMSRRNPRFPLTEASVAPAADAAEKPLPRAPSPANRRPAGKPLQINSLPVPSGTLRGSRRRSTCRRLPAKCRRPQGHPSTVQDAAATPAFCTTTNKQPPANLEYASIGPSSLHFTARLPPLGSRDCFAARALDLAMPLTTALFPRQSGGAQSFVASSSAAVLDHTLRPPPQGRQHRQRNRGNSYSYPSVRARESAEPKYSSSEPPSKP
ncbi:hypothetical protein Purlil1_9168 [Purpureocillium lilacinum]|uniref:Uncharacterized protein n=1 Tax=Purpureocillium lilacinum TaxID=33203 RepID=A0ABR0BR98_PURLI|nr:hypothetical protein Purlil1_9168 [Purpureocillium lilacinum]